MRRARALGLAAALAMVAGCGERQAPTPAASASAASTSASSASADEAAEAPSASATASAAVDAGPPAGPARPLVKTFDAPEESKSPLPKVAEWTDVPRRAVVNRGPYECTMQRVREWHKITCSCTNATVALVAGERNGVSIWSTATQAQLFFPVRRADARAFEVTPHSRTVVVNTGGPYGGPVGVEEEGGPPIVISETWLEGEDAPTLVIQ